MDPRVEPAGPTGTPALTRGDMTAIFLRSFLFQSLWSFQRMQNVGWLFSLWPVFRRLHADPAERALAAQAHAGYFNTHPYTADIILGVAAALEEKRARSGDFQREMILSARRSMSGPLSALGETVFWATLRPLALVASAVAGLVFLRRGWWITPLLYLLIFNALHVTVKAGGLVAGYRRGLEVAAFLVQWPVQRWAGRGAWLGLGLCAGVLVAVSVRAPSPWAAAGTAALCVLFLRRGRSALFLPLIPAAAGILWELVR